MDSAAFLDLLEKSQLLSQEQLAIARVEAKAEGVTVDDLTRSLMQRRWLTKWQRKMLINGKTLFHLGKYKLLSELGRGGMGSVYKAEQGQLRRVVALKMMSAQLLKDQGAVARFHREIQAVASLNHPNIVAAYDADCFHNTHFLVMEYVEGETLGDLMQRKGKLPIPEACEYIRQAALGLQHAHERGMVHRDIKPANLVLTIPVHEDDGESTVPETPKPVVKILDMGLARFSSETADTSELTHSGQIMGTPDYIAPEQAQNTRTADIRSDIFSLGCTFFRALTGALPYGGNNTMEKLMARGMNDAPRVRSLREEVPPELDAVVAKMLARSPAARYQTPVEVARDLASFAAPFSGCAVELMRHGKAGASEATPYASAAPTPASGINPAAFSGSDPKLKTVAKGTAIIGDGETHADEWLSDFQVPVANASATDLVRKKMRKTGWSPGPRELILAAATVVVLLVIVIGMWVWQATGQTVVNVDWPEAEREGASLHVDGKPVPLASSGTVQLRGPPGKRTLTLSRAGYDDVTVSFNLSRGTVKSYHPNWKATSGTVRVQQFTDLGNRVAAGKGQPPHAPGLADLRKELHRLRFESPSRDERQKLSDWPAELTWPIDTLQAKDVPDFERELFAFTARSTTASLVGVYGDSRLKLPGAHQAASFTPEGEALWTCSSDGCIVRWNVATGTPEHVLRVHDRLVAAVFTPDRTRLIGSDDSSVFEWDTNSGKQVVVRHEGQIRTLMTDATGGTVISADSAGHVKAWDRETQKELWKGVEDEYGFEGLCVSRDGQRVAVAHAHGERDPMRVVRIYDGRTGERIHELPMLDQTLKLDFTPDGSHLLRIGEQARLHDLADLAADPKLLSALDQVTGLAVLDPGKVALGRYHDGRVEVWDVALRKHLASFESGVHRLRWLSASPDGRRILIGGEDESLSIWDIAEKPSKVFASTHDARTVHSARITPDGATLVTASYRMLAFWDVATRTVRDHHPYTELQYNLVMAPDAETLYVPADRRIFRWDLKNLAPKADLGGTYLEGEEALNWVFSAAFRPDGKAVAVTDYSRQMVEWDLPAETIRRRFRDGPSGSVSYSPDGRYLVAAGQGRIYVWGEKASEPRGQYGEGIDRTAFTFIDGSLLAMTSHGRIETWETEHFTLKHQVEAYDANPEDTNFALSPSGRLAVTFRSTDGLKFWAVRNGVVSPLGKPIRFKSPFVRVHSLTFTPDERHLLLGCGHGTVAVLRLGIGVKAQ